MVSAKTQASGTPYLLNRDAAMDEKLYNSGKLGLPINTIAAELGCCKDTLRAFFHREPACREAYQNGMAEWRAETDNQKRVAARSYQAQGSLRLQPGEICPHCGQKSGAAAEQIMTFNASDLAQARSKLERLLDRNLDAGDTA